MSKKQFKPNYNLDDKVFVHTIKHDGVIESINRQDESAVVKVFNRENNQHERVEVKFKNVSPYREPKPKKYNPNETYWMVRQFHEAFGHPVSDKPQSMELERATNRAVWTGEECLVEFIHQSSDNEEQFLAAYDNLIAGLDKAKQKALTMEYPKTELERIVGQSDALTDAKYFIDGSFVEMGVKPFNLFRIVQEANMGKLHDGKPVYREDGKIQKPENWERDFAPESKLKSEIERQSK